METKPLTPNPQRISDPLAKALAEVCDMAHDGATPEQCAAVYRSLARNPAYASARGELLRWASLWSTLGAKWR